MVGEKRKTALTYKADLPNGSDSPALITAAGIDNGSVLTNSCFGTPTLPAKINCTMVIKSAFEKVPRTNPLYPSY